MNKKSYFLGFIAGVIVSIVAFLIIGFVRQNPVEKEDADNTNAFETPVSYENKDFAEFNVFQVFGDGALATEVLGGCFQGKVVVLVGKNFYTGQNVSISNPMVVGTYSYESKAGNPMTVPVITGELTE